MGQYASVEEMDVRLRRREIVLGGLAIVLIVGGASALSAEGYQAAAGILAGVGVGATSFVLVLLAVLRLPPPERGPATDSEVAQGLASLTRLDQVVWGGKVERRLRNQDSTIRIHVPKDGIAASTLDLVGRLWGLPVSAFLVGLVLFDLQTGKGVVTGLGWILIAIGILSFGISVSHVFKASKERRAFRRSHR